MARSRTVTNRAAATGCLKADEDLCVTGADVASYTGQLGEEGHTPGFWKTNVDSKEAVAWPRAGTGTLILDPTASVRTLFSSLPGTYDEISLRRPRRDPPGRRAAVECRGGPSAAAVTPSADAHPGTAATSAEGDGSTGEEVAPNAALSDLPDLTSISPT